MRSAYEVNEIRNKYLPGMRVRLVKMDDFQAPPIGTEGTVRGVDDIVIIPAQIEPPVRS